MTVLRAAMFAALSLFHSQALWAQDVTLLSRDGAVEISGTLLGFDGEFYRIDSEFGELTLDGSGVLCDGPGCPDMTAFVAEVAFAGAASLGEVLLPALVESFAVRHGYALEKTATTGGGYDYALTDRVSGQLAGRFGFLPAGSTGAFAALAAGSADVALSLREITGDEADAAKAAGIGDPRLSSRARILALDALVPMVAITNPLQEITLDDLARVLSGQVTRWSDLGGSDQPVSLHVPAAGSGLAGVIDRLILAPRGLEPAAGAQAHADMADLAAAVAADPFALGLGSYSQPDKAVALTLLGPCGARSVAANLNLKTEDYPLSAPVFAYVPNRRLPRIAREFMSYAASPAAQPVVRRAGFVDQFPEAIGVDAQGLRLASAIAAAGDEVSLGDLQEMVAKLSGLARLTVTFRFEGGSTDLDAQSRSNVALLAEALERGVFDDRRLLFVGFSDSQGPADTNRQLARQRARAVREAVRVAAATADQGRITLDTVAFGEAMPMACDDVDWGRSINRRVEVWLD